MYEAKLEYKLSNTVLLVDYNYCQAMVRYQAMPLKKNLDWPVSVYCML